MELMFRNNDLDQRKFADLMPLQRIRNFIIASEELIAMTALFRNVMHGFRNIFTGRKSARMRAMTWLTARRFPGFRFFLTSGLYPRRIGRRRFRGSRRILLAAHLKIADECFEFFDTRVSFT